MQLTHSSATPLLMEDSSVLVHVGFGINGFADKHLYRNKYQYSPSFASAKLTDVTSPQMKRSKNTRD